MVCHQTYKDQDGHWLYPHEVIKIDENRFVTVEGQNPVLVGRSEKMSKSKKNLVDPNSIIETYGADAARLFIMSDTPPERDFEWSEEGIEGAWRYLNRLWRLGESIKDLNERPGQEDQTENLCRSAHQTIIKFQSSYQRNAFNKVIAFGRELTRSLEEAVSDERTSSQAIKEGFYILLIGLGPLIPHITAELWQMVGQTSLLVDAKWPKADPKLARHTEVNIAVQVNGKMRGTFVIAADSDDAALLESALSLPAVRKDLNGRPLKRSIIIPNRIVNLVA
jgi:leucyl-tRNA synthetase